MSTKKITAGDTLTVGDLTDDHLGAVIEVGPEVGLTTRMRLQNVGRGNRVDTLFSDDGGFINTLKVSPVTVIAPPPVVQPDEPTILGQCIRIDEEDGWWGIVVAPEAVKPFISARGTRWSWAEILDAADGRRIVVSDPPRWPDETPEAEETPVVPERIEEGEWPDDDTHLREWEWIGHLDYRWRWYAEETRKSGWAWTPDAVRRHNPIRGPWTRGERVK